MKDHVENYRLTKFDVFRVNRDQPMDLEIWFQNHTNVYILLRGHSNECCNLIGSYRGPDFLSLPTGTVTLS